MNPRFRNYVTDTAFKMSLGKTHITAMVAIKQAQIHKNGVDQLQIAGYPDAMFQGYPRIAHEMGLWVGAVRSLEDKGLINIKESTLHLPYWERYTITQAGELVWALLIEAGLVEEVKPKSSKRHVA